MSIFTQKKLNWSIPRDLSPYLLTRWTRLIAAFYLRSRYTLKLRKARDNPPPPSSFLALISLSPIFFSLSWFTLAMKQQPHYAARCSHLPPPPAHGVLSQRLFHHILSVTSGFLPPSWVSSENRNFALAHHRTTFIWQIQYSLPFFWLYYYLLQSF